jgi:hypothetical protein
MPWWGWLLAALGVLVLLGVAWVALFVYLMSKGDRTD